VRHQLAAPGGVEAPPLQLQLQPHTQPPHQRRKGAFQKIKRRRHRVVRATRQLDLAQPVGQHQRGQHRLQHQQATACGGNLKTVVARTHYAGCEHQRLRIQLRALGLPAAHGHRRLHAGQVLAHQPRLGPPRTDARDVQWAAGDHGQGQAGAQDLAAAFAGGAV